jgi:hypothetical protein
MERSKLKRHRRLAGLATQPASVNTSFTAWFACIQKEVTGALWVSEVAPTVVAWKRQNPWAKLSDNQM